MAICKVDDQKKALSSIVSIKKGDIKSAYWDTFGAGYGLRASQIDAFRGDLNNLNDALFKAKRELVKQKGLKHRGEALDLKKDIVNIKKAIKQISKKVTENKRKREVLKDLESTLNEHIMILADTNFYGDHIKPENIFPVLKEFMQTKLTGTFNELSDLDTGTLLRFTKLLSRTLAKIQNIAEKDKGINSFRNTVLPPKLVAAILDPTGLAYKPIDMAGELAANVAGDGAKHYLTIEEGITPIRELVDNGYMFMHTPKGEITTGDEEISFDNVGNFVAEQLDGQVKNIIPTPIVQRKADGQPIFTKEFEEDEKVWKQRIKENINNGLHASGWVQSFVDKNGKKYYYVLIDKVNDKGEEYYRAYEVPYEEFESTTGGLVDRLTFPPSMRKKSLEFFHKWFRRDEDSLAGYQRINPADGKAEHVPGKMQSGWYRTTAEKGVYGKKTLKGGKTKEIYSKNYTDYKLDEDLNKQEMHPDIWKAIRDLRLMYKEMHDDNIRENQEYEDKLLALVTRMFPEGMPRGGRNEINTFIKEKLGLDIGSIDMNMAIRRVNGKDVIYTPNTTFGELNNYLPRKKAYAHNILDMQIAIASAESSLAFNREALETNQVDSNDSNERIAQIEEREAVKNKIKDYEEILDNYYAELDYRLGLTESAPAMNQTTLIKSSKHRSKITRSLEDSITVKDPKTGEEVTALTNAGIRKDWHIHAEYITESYTSLNQNKVKLALLDAIHKGMPDAIKDYTIDHVKSSFGRRDVDAGFLNWNYSDKKWARRVNKLRKAAGFDEETPEQLYNRGKYYSGLISANLLSGPGVSIANNFQRVGSAIITDYQTMKKAGTKRKANLAKTEEYANNAGLLDETNAIGDIFMGQTDARFHWLDGMKFWRNAAILKLTKNRFLTAAMNTNTRVGQWWNQLVDILEPTIEGKFKSDELARRALLEDVWENITGLRELGEKGQLTAVQKRAFKKRLNNTISEHLLNKHIQWAFHGNMLTHRFFPGTDLFQFVQVEKNMRMEQIYVAGSMLVKNGRLQKNLTDKELYTHPETVKLARLLVNNVMFSMSQANLPKMFKGFTGVALWKFKPYQWNQIGVEWNIIEGMFDEVRASNWTERGRIIKNIVTSRKQGSTTMNQFRNFMVYRVFISQTAISLLNLTPLRIPLRALSNRVPGGFKFFSAYGRGSTSQIAEGLMDFFMIAMAFGGFLGSDEEEKAWKDWRRWILPLWVNLIWEAHGESNVLKALQPFSKDAATTIEWGWDYIDENIDF